MFDLTEIDLMRLAPFAVFGLFVFGAWILVDLLNSKGERARQRLDEIRDPSLRRRGGPDGGHTGDRFNRVLERATPTLAKPLQPKNEFEANKLKRRLAHAGFRGEIAPSVFLGVKFVMLIAGLVISGGVYIVLYGLNISVAARTIVTGGIAFYVPDAVLWLLTKKRKEAIFLSLPDALDLMVVCVEAGLALDQAMRRVAEELGKAYPVLAREFSLCNFQLQMGRPRADVLHELGERTGVDDLRALAAILIQADKFGSSIAQALRVQSESMRTRRRQLAEEKAAKTAVQLIFPLVIFIFPGIFVVLVGPAAITMIRELFPRMGGG